MWNIHKQTLLVYQIGAEMSSTYKFIGCISIDLIVNNICLPVLSKYLVRNDIICSVYLDAYHNTLRKRWAKIINAANMLCLATYWFLIFFVLHKHVNQFWLCSAYNAILSLRVNILFACFLVLTQHVQTTKCFDHDVKLL